MNFMNIIDSLRHVYNPDECGVLGNALLYGVCKLTPPLAEHIVFKPILPDAMKGMLDSYKRTFPRELLMLYQAMNGADLFWTVRFIGKKKIRIPSCRFAIYGVPLSYDRTNIEPFNIAIEDLNRPKGTPDSWLKFGSYYRPEDPDHRLDLFVDTEQTGVFAIEHDSSECCVVSRWDSIDNCLCNVYSLLACNINNRKD